MKAVIQRVSRASVSVNGEIVSSIQRGLCVLLGMSRHDQPGEIDYMVRKILNIRLFEDDNGKRWSKSAKDLELEILCVSQFTLHSILKGNKPDFHRSMEAERAEQMYGQFLDQMRKAYVKDRIKDGKFGEMMSVNIENDGPVTIQLESPNEATNQSSTSSS